MASKGNVEFRTLLNDIKSNKTSPVYILMGEEPYYLDRLVDAFEAFVIKEEEKDFNLSVYYGQEIDIPTVIATCQQYPFMADKKLVILKEAQSMDRAKTKLEALAEYLLHPNQQNVLVICFKGDNLNSTSALMKAAGKSNSIVFKSPKLWESELPGPLRDYCRSKKIGIDEKSIAMLIDYIGADLGKLFGEIDKLIVAGVGDGAKITPVDIEKHIGISKDFNNFELQKALAYKNFDRSLQIIKYFESNPKNNPTVVTTGILFGFYSKVLIGHFMSDKSDDGLMVGMGVKSRFKLEEYKAAMSRYSPVQTIKIIGLLRQFDTQSKGIDSFQNEYKLLKELIYNIFTVK